MKYAYSTQGSHFTNRKPFGHALSPQLLGPTLVAIGYIIPAGVYGTICLPVLWAKLQPLIRASLAKAYPHYMKPHQEYKHNYNRHVGELPIHNPINLAFLNRPSSLTEWEKNASNLSLGVYQKLLLQCHCTNQLIRLNPHTITTDDNDIFLAVSIDNSMPALISSPKVVPWTQRDTAQRSIPKRLNNLSFQGKEYPINTSIFPSRRNRTASTKFGDCKYGFHHICCTTASKRNLKPNLRGLGHQQTWG